MANRRYELIDGQWEQAKDMIQHSIPFYKLFDKEESCISDSMLPYEIEAVLDEKIEADSMQQQWIDTIKQFSDMKLYLQRYQQVVQVPLNERCFCGLQSFIDSLSDQVNRLWNAFLLSKPLANGMLEGSWRTKS